MDPVQLALLLGWLCWVSYPLCHRGAFSLWTYRQRLWYEDMLKRTGWGLPIATYGLGMLVGYPLFTWAAWQYSLSDAEPLSTITVLFVVVTLGMDKIWSVLLWDRRDAKAAFYVALLVALLYGTCSVLAGVTPKDWEKLPLAILCAVFALWFVGQALIVWHWGYLPGMWNTREEQFERPEIKGKIHH